MHNRTVQKKEAFSIVELNVYSKSPAMKEKQNVVVSKVHKRFDG